MNLQPLNNRVLVRSKKAEEKTKGGIYIPEAAQEKSQEGTIAAIPQIDKCPVAVGDVVLYESFAGTEIQSNGETLILLKIEDLIAKIKS